MHSLSRARWRTHFLSAVTEGSCEASHQSALSCVPSHLEQPQWLVVAGQCGGAFHPERPSYPAAVAQISAVFLGHKLLLLSGSRHRTALRSPFCLFHLVVDWFLWKPEVICLQCVRLDTINTRTERCVGGGHWGRGEEE